MFVTETWFQDDVTDSMISNGDRYHIIRCDRSGRRGGEVCALVCEDIKYSRVSLTDVQRQLLIQSCCDLICFDVIWLNFKYRFILVYRPPHSSGITNDRVHSECLSTLILNLSPKHGTTIILGDLNLPHIDWFNNRTMNNDFDHNCLFECFSNLGLSQFVLEPTRLNLNGVSNTLDVILSNDPLIINIIEVSELFSTSDHCMINFSLLLPPSKQHTSVAQPSDQSPLLPIYDWSAGNFEAINNSLSNVDWHLLFGYNFNADDLWIEFKKIIWPIIDLHVPRKLVHHCIKYKPRQYPKFIRKLLSRKAAMWRRLRDNPTVVLKQSYTKVAYECKLAIHDFDARRESHVLESNNLGAFYKFVNNKLGNNRGIAPLHDSHGKLIVSDVDKANLINNYLQSVFTCDNHSLPDFPTRLPPNSPGICDVTISPIIVHRIIRKLKINSAAGPDGIPPIFFKNTDRTLNSPLTLLFRSFIDLHSLPQEWKLSTVTPIFKKGDPADPSNYRPIALTCTCCKILESIIANELTNFLIDHKLISKSTAWLSQKTFHCY